MALPEPLVPVFVGDPLPAALNAERQAINDLTGEVGTKISAPAGAMTGDLLRWDGTRWLTTDTRFLEGEGRPDGQVAAPIGSRYIDKVGAQGAVEWVKRAGGDTNVGWICIAGDTGLRNIAALIAKPAGAIVHLAYISRVGTVVDLTIDVTMPNANGTWTLLSALSGFGPGYNRYAALQDNSEVANTGGSMVEADCGVLLYKTLAGKRDRFTGTWTTRDPWPTVLPGAAV